MAPLPKRPGELLRRGQVVGRRTADELYAAGICVRAGLLRPEPPRQTAAVVQAVRRYGGLGAAPAIAARRHPERVGLVDERGSLTFAELDRRANALANAWRARGLEPGDGVAILARNHRGFIDATFAAAKAGARAILLNTDFAGPQIREVAEREGARLLVHDDEYTRFLEGVAPPLGRWRAWTDEPAEDTLEALIARGDERPPPPPSEHGKLIVLTSGTTGSPKGAARGQPKSLTPLGALFGKVPFRAGETTVIAAPLFHALGFAHAVVAVALGSTMVLRRKFDPAVLLDDLERHRATALIVVPVMLRRALAHEAQPRSGRDLRALRIVFVAGSQLGGELCERALAAFGPVIYNLYGSTEVAYAAIATPDELLAAPDSVGTPPQGAIVRLYDADGRGVERTGETGRIFVANSFGFDGYTGGGTKDMIDGLMSSGDVGHFDEAGRLFIDGRDDDMIVSGGENVFPGEIEELLLRHQDVGDAAVIGIEDPEWGHRLRAFVVPVPGASPSEDDLKAYVRDNLARFKAPRDVVFVEELPRNPTGKVLKRELIESSG